MKKLIFAVLAIVVMGGASLFNACKKETSEPTGCGNGGGGIIGVTDKTITFWMAKDFGCGPLNFVSITSKADNNSNYRVISASSSITVYNSQQPMCEASGTVSVLVDRGRTYSYKFKCNSREFTGEFTTDCTNTCQLVEIK